MAYENYNAIRALIIDDFKNFRDSLSIMLQRFGVEHIDTVGSPGAAIKRCQSRQYDLVFCDYNLGDGKNGVEVVETVRELKYLGKNCLLVMITAETNRSVVMATYDCSPDAYLCKPISTNYLKYRLDRLLTQHENFKGIYEAIEADALDEASVMCEANLNEGGRNALKCQRMLGEIYLKQHDLVKAESLFHSVLEQQELVWARVGFAQVLYMSGDHESACAILHKVLKDNPHHLEAYDLLAKIYYEDGETETSQSIVEESVKMCPLSVPRKRRLGDIARDNQDLERALQAYKECIDMGQNSCFDTAENHINFGRATAALFEVNEESAERWSEEATEVLHKVNERFKTTFQEELQLMLVQSHLYKEMGEDGDSDTLLEQALKLRQNHIKNLNLDTELDLVGALNAHGELERVEAIMNGLLEKFSDDDVAMMKIDRFLAEPQSALNRKRVAKLNTDGVEHYNNERFIEAIECFRKAKQMFPRHTGVLLNLAQAANGHMESAGVTEEYIKMSESVLRRVGRRIQEDDPLYSRYLRLDEHLSAIVSRQKDA